MSIKVDFGLKRLDKIIEELETQIQYLNEQKESLEQKRNELQTCEKLINY